MDDQELIDKLQTLAHQKLEELQVAALNAGADYDLRVRFDLGARHEIDITIRGGKPLPE